MLTAIASGYLIAALAPLIARVFRSASGPVLAIVPGYLLAWLLQFVPDAAEGRSWRFAFPWGGPGGLEAVFSLDALALLFGAMIALLSIAALLSTGGLALSPAARGRALLALLSLMTSALGFVFADTPVLIMGFSVLATLSVFLLLTARRGAVARARRTPVLMALLAGDLALIAALAGLFIGSGALGLAELSSHALSGSIVVRIAAVLLALAGLVRLIVIPADLQSARAEMMSESAVLLVQGGAYLPLTLYMALRIAPALGAAPDVRLALGIAGAALLVASAVTGLGARRLRTLLAALTLAFCAAVFIHLAALGAGAVNASVLLLLTHAFALGALLLASQLISRGGSWLSLDALASTTRGQPFRLALFAIAVLALTGLLPSLATLTLSQSLGAGLAPQPNPAEIAFAIAAQALVIAFALLIARAMAKPAAPAPSDAKRSPAIAAAAILLLAFLIVPGWYPLVLERLFVAAVAVRSGATVPLGAIWPQGIAIVFALAAFATAGVLVWLDSRIKRALAWCAPALPRRPERMWRGLLTRANDAGRAGVALAGRISYASIAVGLAALICALFVWLAVELLAGPKPIFALGSLGFMPTGALAVCAAAAALVAMLQPDCARFATLLPIASLLAALTLLAQRITDLAYLLILILVIETAILLVLSTRRAEAPMRSLRPRLVRTVRIGLALVAGAGAALTDIAVSNLSLDPTSWTRFDQIELWASLLVLVLALGVVATSLRRAGQAP